MKKIVAPLVLLLCIVLIVGCADYKDASTETDSVSSVLSVGGGNSGQANQEELQGIPAGKIARALGIMAYEVEDDPTNDRVLITLLDDAQKTMGTVKYTLAGDNGFDMSATLDVDGTEVSKVTMTHLDISSGVVVHAFAFESNGTAIERWAQLSGVNVDWMRLAVLKSSVTTPPTIGAEFSGPTGDYYILSSLAPDGTKADDATVEQWLNETGRAALLTHDDAATLMAAISDLAWMTAMTSGESGTVSGGLSVQRGAIHLSDECGIYLVDLSLAAVAADIACGIALSTSWVPFMGIIATAVTCSLAHHLTALTVAMNLNCRNAIRRATKNCDGHCEGYERGTLPESGHGACDCHCDAAACSDWCVTKTSPPEGQQVCSEGHACTLDGCTCNIAKCGDGNQSSESGCLEPCETNEDCAWMAAGDEFWACYECVCVLQPTTSVPDPK